MRKRIKDLAFQIKVKKETLLDICDKLDINESNFYKSWNEPKKDPYKNPLKDSEGNIKTRPINAPIKPLKKIQSKILKNVLYRIELPKNFFGGLKGKDAVLNSKFHQGNKFFLLTDFKSFYPSISSKRVEQALRNEGFYPDVARLITRLCTSQGRIPQGCPTSSFLSALVLKHTISDFIKDYENESFKVTVYVDDITISSSIDFKNKVPEILNKLREKDLKINFEKTYYKTKSPNITGVIVKNNSIVPPQHTFSFSKDILLSESSRLGHQQRIKYIKSISEQKFNHSQNTPDSNK